MQFKSGQLFRGSMDPLAKVLTNYKVISSDSIDVWVDEETAPNKWMIGNKRKNCFYPKVRVEVARRLFKPHSCSNVDSSIHNCHFPHLPTRIFHTNDWCWRSAAKLPENKLKSLIISMVEKSDSVFKNCPGIVLLFRTKMGTNKSGILVQSNNAQELSVLDLVVTAVNDFDANRHVVRSGSCLIRSGLNKGFPSYTVDGFKEPFADDLDGVIPALDEFISSTK